MLLVFFTTYGTVLVAEMIGDKTVCTIGESGVPARLSQLLRGDGVGMWRF